MNQRPIVVILGRRSHSYGDVIYVCGPERQQQTASISHLLYSCVIVAQTPGTVYNNKSSLM